MRNILIIGGTRGLGHSLVRKYARDGFTVYTTSRYSCPQSTDPNIHWIPNIDITSPGSARTVSYHWAEAKADLVVICANYFATETPSHLDYNKEVEMYKTNAIGPLFLVKGLVETGIIQKGSKIVIAGNEKGSIALRRAGDAVSNYAGHGSKAALNMMAKLLSIELQEKDIPVAVVHSGYLRQESMDGGTEWGDGVGPDKAANALIEWVKTLDMGKTGQFWAVRGVEGIKNAEAVLDPMKALDSAVELPW